MNRCSFLARVRHVPLALVLVATACSGSSADIQSSQEQSTTTEVVAGTTTTTVAETTTTTEAEATTTTVAIVATTSAPIELDATDANVIAYCESSADADALSDATDVFDPDALRTLVAFQIDTLSALDAPEPIADDISTILDVFLQYPTILEPVGYDINQAQAELGALATTSEFTTATDNLDLFEADYCPNIVPDEPTTTGNPSGITEEQIREFLSTPEGREGVAAGVVTTSTMTQEEAVCFVEMTDPDTLVELFQLGSGEIAAPSAEGQAGLASGLAACGLDLSVFGQ